MGRADAFGEALVDHLRDGAHDADIAGAAAEIAAEIVADALFVGLVEPQYDVARRDDHAWRAEAALQRVVLGKRPAKGRHDRVGLKAFDRLDHGAVVGVCISDARTDRLAVDQNGAGAANPLFAGQMRPGQVQPVTQNGGELRAGLDLGMAQLAVDGDGNLAHGRSASWIARSTQTATCWRFTASMRGDKEPTSFNMSSNVGADAVVARRRAAFSSSKGAPPTDPATTRA